MPINESPDPRSSMWAWIARDLRFYRERRGQSGQAVARLLNVGRSSISRLENDQARLTEDQAVILDKAWSTGGHFTLMVWYASKGHDPEWLCDVKSHVSSECMIGGRWKVEMHSRLVPEPVPAVTCVLAS